MRSWILIAIVPLTAGAQPTLTVKEAVARALAAHPALRESAERVSASEGLLRQAGLRPNPRFAFQTENLGANGRPGFDYGRDADTFAYLSQLIETGGKRRRRVDAASAATRRAELERELLARHLASRVKWAYWSAEGAGRARHSLEETLKTFARIVQYHEMRVREGAMAEADLLRVRLESERIALAANTATLEAERARIQLFREMGALSFPEIQFESGADELEVALPEADPARALDARIEMKLARQAVQQARAKLDLERATAAPDVDAVAGYKRTAGYNTMIGGVQIALPFGNRNQGNIAAALAEVRAAESAEAATAALIHAETRAAKSEYDLRSRQIQTSLGPLMEHAVEASRIAQAAYREGGTDLLRLLDAERAHLDAQLLYCRSLAEYRQSIVNLETALGAAP
jgi:cobalt-zinc-cadmium efflux system outer membrane protein